MPLREQPLLPAGSPAKFVPILVSCYRGNVIGVPLASAQSFRSKLSGLGRRIAQAPTAALLAAMLALVGLAHSPALRAGLTNWDDRGYLTSNADVVSPRLGTILHPLHWTVSDWTPTVTISHAIEYRLFGFTPAVYHATNLALHLGCVILVYLLLRAVGLSRGAALIASCIFGIHPLQVESVAWVSARKNQLAAVFGLSYIVAHLAARPLPALICLLLALGSKGTAVVFPLWALAAALLGIGRSSRPAPLLLSLFHIGLAIPRAALSAYAQAGVAQNNGLTEVGVGGRMAAMGPILLTQLRQFFLPYDLCALYQRTPRLWTDWPVRGSWTALAVAMLALAWAVRNQRSSLYLLCIGVAALLPTIGIWPPPSLQADRYLHLALIAPAALVGIAVGAPGRCGRVLRVAIPAWCLLVLLPATFLRSQVWQSSTMLWRDTVARYPTLAFAWNMLADDYLTRNQPIEAESALRRSLALVPDQRDARFNLALLLTNNGNYEAALLELRQLLEIHPEGAESLRLLARILEEHGRPEEALVALDDAVRRYPESTINRFRRGKLLAKLGKIEPAEADFETLTELLASQGRPSQAKSAALEGIAVLPESPNLYFRLAVIEWNLHEVDAARSHANKALALLGSVSRPWRNEAVAIAGAPARTQE